MEPFHIFTQIGSDNTNMIRSVCNHCKKELTSTYYWWLLRPTIISKFQIIAQLFNSIRFEMKNTIRTALKKMDREWMKAAKDDVQMTDDVDHSPTELHLYLLHTSPPYHRIHRKLTRLQSHSRLQRRWSETTIKQHTETQHKLHVSKVKHFAIRLVGWARFNIPLDTA